MVRVSGYRCARAPEASGRPQSDSCVRANRSDLDFAEEVGPAISLSLFLTFSHITMLE